MNFQHLAIACLNPILPHFISVAVCAVYPVITNKTTILTIDAADAT